ncbi:MAG TPA: DUF2012 domain-containing protein [Gemmatimonadaceae bacterium]
MTSTPRATPFLLAATCLLTIVACGGERPAGATVANDSATMSRAEEPARPPYRVVDVRNGGAIVGRVLATGPTPDDTTVAASADSGVCGATRVVPLVERRGDRLENVVVWLDDARAGKPLPAERRYEIEHDACAIEPRVQAAVAGGMLNVRSSDRAVHRARFIRSGATIDLVQETDAGQVVPTEKVLARPGLVEVRCDRHPSTRAWIRVFDHPYYAVTNRDGTFTLDSVPPGTYTLEAWQPRLGVRTMKVTVGKGTDVKVDVAF